MSKVFVGIDVSKKELSITMIIGGKYEYYVVANNKEGFDNFAGLLASRNIDKVNACMESTGIYGFAFADYLHDLKHEVSIVSRRVIIPGSLFL